MQTTSPVSDATLDAIRRDVEERVSEANLLAFKQISLSLRASVLGELRDFVGAKDAYEASIAMNLEVDVARFAAMAALQRLESATRLTHG